MFFYPEIRDETSRLGQRRLAQDARIKRVLAASLRESTGLHCCIGILNHQPDVSLTLWIYWLLTDLSNYGVSDTSNPAASKKK